MKKVIFVLWSLLLTWELPLVANKVTISDSNPVQFWPIAESTYNETAVCSIEPVFWCQPFEGDDEIRLQFLGDEYFTYNLIAYDDQDVELQKMPFGEIGDDLFELDFLIDGLSGKINPPTSWGDEDFFGLLHFTKDSTSFSKTASGSFQSLGATRALPKLIEQGVTVTIPLTIVVTGSFNPGIFYVTVRFFNGNPAPSGVPCDNAFSHSGLTPGTYNDTIVFTMTNAPATYIEIQCGIPTTPSSGAISITIGDIPLCNVTDEISLKIEETETFDNYSFDAGTLLPWHQVADGGIGFWAIDTGTNRARLPQTFAGVPGTSSLTIALRHHFAQVQATAKKFSFQVIAGIRSASVGSWNNSELYAVYYINGIEIGNQLINTFADNSDSGILSFTTSVSNFDEIGFRIKYKYTSSFGFSGAWTVDISSFFPSDVAGTGLQLNSGITYKSDCISIKPQVCTELITYSNSNPFDDIAYPEISPSSVFKLRVPAVFFEEEFPDEYESIDLSNSEIVQLSSEVKHKKLFDVGWMPFYMIQKLQLVLAHDNVIIQGKNWIKGDGMTKIQGNKRYPLRRTQFLLTDRDFIKRNVL